MARDLQHLNEGGPGRPVAAPAPELTFEDVRRIVAESRASGTSDKTVADVLADAKRVAKARAARIRTDE